MSPAQDAVDLHPAVARVQKLFSVQDDALVLAPKARSEAEDLLGKVKPADRLQVASELVAVALKFQAAERDATARAVEQLVELAALLMEDAGAAVGLFEEAGVDKARVAAALGGSVSNQPVQGKAGSRNSLFSLQLRKK